MLVSAIHQHESATGTHMKIILLYSSIDLMQCLSKSQLAFCLEIEKIVLKFICMSKKNKKNKVGEHTHTHTKLNHAILNNLK